MTAPMLTREEIAEMQFGGRPANPKLCSMALALLDVAELVPGDGDVVERVRHLNGEVLDGLDVIETREERIAALETELAQRTKERDGATAAYEQAQRDLSALRQALANARDEGPWAWMSGEDNHLESMSDGMVVRISAGQLRELLSRADAELAEARKIASVAVRDAEETTDENDEVHSRFIDCTHELDLARQLFAEESIKSAQRIDDLRTKLAALADAAECYRNCERDLARGAELEADEFSEASERLDAAIAEARKGLP